MLKRPPRPRLGSFYGMPVLATGGAENTWLEGEEFAYPSDSFTRRAYVRIDRNEHAPIDLPYGQYRVVLCKTPDTYFTIPARLRVKGVTYAGFVSSSHSGDEEVFTFTPEARPDLCVICKDGDGCKR